MTQVLKTTLTKSKGKSAAKNIKKQLQYIKKILIEGTTVSKTRIGKESK